MSSTSPAYDDSYGGILKMALPLGLAILAVIGNTIIDIAMIGRLGVEAVAAATLGMQLYFVAFVACQGFVMAFPPVYTKALGQGDKKALPSIFAGMVYILVPVSVLAFLLLYFGDYILLLTGQDPHLVALSEGYGNVIAIAIVPALLQGLLWEVNSIYERSRHIAMVSLICFAANIGFNWLLIYGNAGFPALGITGAAISTSLTAFLSAFLLLVPFRRYLRPEPGMFDAAGHYARQMIRLGTPIAFTEGFTMAFFVATTFVVGWYGDRALAAHIIAFQVSEIAITFAIGFSEVASIKTGMASGSAGRAMLYRLLRRLIAVTMGVSFIMVIALLGGASFYPDLYLDGGSADIAAVKELATLLILISAGFTLFDSLQFVLLGALRGLQDTRIPMILAFIGYWLVGLPSGIALAEWAGLDVVGIWIGLVIGLVTVSVMLGLRLWQQAQRHPAIL